MSEIIATLTPRPGRRWLAVLMQGGLGVLLIFLAFEMPAGARAWGAVLLVAGLVALVGAFRLYRSTALRVELTREDIRDSSGMVLARLEDIRGIDRGAFAFKPSNGFLLRLKAPGKRAWRPGLWWRVGRYVGVGGVTPRNEAKTMAEFIAAEISIRNEGV